MLVATGKADISVSELDPIGLEKFVNALESVFINLARELIKDGEGASKFVTVNVTQGASDNECLRVAYAIAESPLVKTALFASDPNWGRILAAVGRAGIEDLDLNAVTIDIGDVRIVSAGSVDSNYTEAKGQAIMALDEIEITGSLQRGSSSESVWTSDLSHDYVSINAGYRT